MRDDREDKDDNKKSGIHSVRSYSFSLFRAILYWLNSISHKLLGVPEIQYETANTPAWNCEAFLPRLSLNWNLSHL